MCRYNGIIDYSDYILLMKISYHQTALMFEHPFYFITYAFARIGALQLRNIFRNNSQKCVNRYLYALSVGENIGMKNLYNAAGVEFGFREDCIFQLVRNIKNEVF